MKKTLALVLVVLSLAVFSPAATRLGFSAGYAKHIESSFGAGLAAGFSLGFDLTPMFAVEARGSLITSSVSDSPTGLSKGSMTLVPLEIALTARFGKGKKLVPYAAVGGGYGLNSFKVDSGLKSDWNDVGMNLSESLKGGLTILVAGGIDYLLKPGPKPGQGIFLNIEVRYLMSKAEGSWSLTDIASEEKASGVLDSLNLDSLVVGVGVKYGF